MKVWVCYVLAKGVTEGIRDVKRCGTRSDPPSATGTWDDHGRGLIIGSYSLWQFVALLHSYVIDGP